MSASLAQAEIGFSRHSRAEGIDLRWTRFLAENPEALAEFRDIALELVEAGEERLSAKFLIEIARYRQIIRRSAGQRWAVNNDFPVRGRRWARKRSLR